MVQLNEATRLRLNDLDPKLPQLTRVQAAQRQLPDHRMARTSSPAGLDLHAHHSETWPHVIEIAMRVLVRHAAIVLGSLIDAA